MHFSEETNVKFNILNPSSSSPNPLNVLLLPQKKKKERRKKRREEKKRKTENKTVSASDKKENKIKTKQKQKL